MAKNNEKIIKGILIFIIVLLVVIFGIVAVINFYMPKKEYRLPKEMTVQHYYRMVQITGQRGQETVENYLFIDNEDKVIETRVAVYNCSDGLLSMAADNVEWPMMYNIDKPDDTTLIYNTIMSNGKSREEGINFYKDHQGLTNVTVKEI